MAEPDRIDNLYSVLSAGRSSLEDAPESFLLKCFEIESVLSKYADWLSAYQRERNEAPSNRQSAEKLDQLLSYEKATITQEAQRRLRCLDIYFKQKFAIDELEEKINSLREPFWKQILVSFLGSLFAPVLLYLSIWLVEVVKNEAQLRDFFNPQAVITGLNHDIPSRR